MSTVKWVDISTLRQPFTSGNVRQISHFAFVCMHASIAAYYFGSEVT
ncbi:MAG: hypothetical protein R8K53_07070 [Mariprofundaceae bacterium]